jgi:hypothetical protein
LLAFPSQRYTPRVRQVARAKESDLQETLVEANGPIEFVLSIAGSGYHMQKDAACAIRTHVHIYDRSAPTDHDRRSRRITGCVA